MTGEWAQRLGSSVPDWPAFPGLRRRPGATAKPLPADHPLQRAPRRLRRQPARLRGDFAAVITAEDVGAYKPAENHFRALDRTLTELGVEAAAELLHVAQSLFHDHVPAKREGLPSVWINRRHDRPGWGATPEPLEEWTYNLEFTSMGLRRRRRPRPSAEPKKSGPPASRGA